jgi:hypothetical protein
MKKPIDIDALVAEAVPPRPNPQLVFTMPVRVDSHTNSWCGWKATWKKQKTQKNETFVAWNQATRGVCSCVLSLPCVVRLTRVGQKRLDDDNLRESFKAVRDAIARIIGIDDGDERIKWEYEQVAVGKRVYQVRVEVY